MIALSIDGGPQTIVDQYGVARERMMFWQSDVLPAGQHTMRARVTGDQNPESRYIWVTLECVEIDGWTPELTERDSSSSLVGRRWNPPERHFLEVVFEPPDG